MALMHFYTPLFHNSSCFHTKYIRRNSVNCCLLGVANIFTNSILITVIFSFSIISLLRGLFLTFRSISTIQFILFPHFSTRNTSTKNSLITVSVCLRLSRCLASFTRSVMVMTSQFVYLLIYILSAVN